MSIQNDVNQIETVNILNSLIDLGYEEKTENDFIVEILGEKTEEIKTIADQFNGRIRSISNIELKKIASPITMTVIKVNPDGSVDVDKPSSISTDSSGWTHIPNPTIFQHLQVGDEVVLGYYDGEQKSNCWVMFAKLIDSNIREKSICKDIENLYTINDNTEFLKKWLHKAILKSYPDIEKTVINKDGSTYTYTVPDPTRLQFEREMYDQWKVVVNNGTKIL